jgi:DNA modification methylase
MIEFGDCRETMRKWAEQGVKAQTCVTSPPYYGLRDYGHEGQIGLEETPEQYIAAMVEVFRCVWDVMEDDGTLWLNLGDSYAGSGKGQMGDGSASDRKSAKQGTSAGTLTGGLPIGNTGLASKQLVGIPWRVALALQADGWILRQDIIWHKPNPMPESVQDRCTKAHEYIFLLSKSQKYYFDNEAIAEPLAASSVERLAQPTLAEQTGSDRVPGKTNGNMKAVGNGETRNKRSVWTVTTKPYKGAHFATFPPALITPCILAGAPAGGIVLDPFMGSGTTAAVAIANGRDYLGCELNPAYKELQDLRIKEALNEISQMELI